MRITDVTTNKRYSDMKKVFVDGEYCFSISEDDFMSLALYEKEEITNEEITNIKQIVNFKSAKGKAINYLSYKYRTKKEVYDKLTDLGYKEETVQTVINELISIGYINDKIYAQKFISDRIKLKPMSKKALEYELLSKGVSKQIISETLDDYELDDYDLAFRIAKRKFSKYDIDDIKIQTKIFSFLAHKGFDSEVCCEVINKLQKAKY